MLKAVVISSFKVSGGTTDSYKHLRAHETRGNTVYRRLLEKKKKRKMQEDKAITHDRHKSNHNQSTKHTQEI
ncbi:hypothetical protein ACISOF_09050, partial [Campylobacter jejuni]